jgi:hypothetical protein
MINLARGAELNELNESQSSNYKDAVLGSYIITVFSYIITVF